ncbi:hypothetical protein ACFL1Q_00525 [Patescibacteria group bacterium]
MVEYLKDSLLNKPWNYLDYHHVREGSWKNLDTWVYGYRATQPDRNIWDMIEFNPITPKTIERLHGDNWKVHMYESKEKSGYCLREKKELGLSEIMKGYMRDIVLFHEITHACYGDELSDDENLNRRDALANGVIADWLARMLRSDYTLLRTVIYTFGLTPYIYDKVSHFAFEKNPPDLRKQYSFPWGKGKRYTSLRVLMGFEGKIKK